MHHLSNERGEYNAELMMSECYLADVFGCADSSKDLVKAGNERIKKIINLSQLRQDNIYVKLAGKLAIELWKLSHTLP